MENAIVDDGLIDKSLYEQQKIRVLHLLKEPTEPNTSLSDIVERLGEKIITGKNFFFKGQLEDHFVFKTTLQTGIHF